MRFSSRLMSVSSLRYGRRFVLLLSIALQTVFGVAVAFAPNFPVYVVLRFAVGTTISGVIINAFVLGTSQKTNTLVAKIEAKKKLDKEFWQNF